MPTDLSKLSFTSRLAFYALYEACRLLQDITNTNIIGNNNNNNSTSSRHGRPQGRQRRQVRQRRSRSAQGARDDQVVPDVVPHEQHLDDHVSLFVNNVGDEVDASPSVGSTQRHARAAQQQQHDDEEEQVQGKRTEKDLPDLVQDDHHVFHHHDLPYHKSHDFDSDDDDDDGGKLKPCAAAPSGPWSSAGLWLCRLALALESNLRENNDVDRRVTDAYSRMRRRVLERDLDKNSSNNLGLVGSVGRQVLLSTVWMLIRKVL
jgi:hypothetical protein